MSVDSPNIETIVADVEHLKKSVSELQVGLEANTRMTQRIEKNTAEVVEAFAAMSGAFKVFNFIGTLAKPLAWILTVIGGLAVTWAHLKNWAAQIFK